MTTVRVDYETGVAVKVGLGVSVAGGVAVAGVEFAWRGVPRMGLPAASDPLRSTTLFVLQIEALSACPCCYTFHTRAGWAVPGRPAAAGNIGSINRSPGWIEQFQALTAIAQVSCINLIRGDVCHSPVIRALEQVITARSDGAAQGNFYITTISQHPTAEINCIAPRIINFDPLVD